MQLLWEVIVEWLSILFITLVYSIKIPKLRGKKKYDLKTHHKPGA